MQAAEDKVMLLALSSITTIIINFILAVRRCGT